MSPFESIITGNWLGGGMFICWPAIPTIWLGAMALTWAQQYRVSTGVTSTQISAYVITHKNLAVCKLMEEYAKSDTRSQHTTVNMRQIIMEGMQILCERKTPVVKVLLKCVIRFPYSPFVGKHFRNFCMPISCPLAYHNILQSPSCSNMRYYTHNPTCHKLTDCSMFILIGQSNKEILLVL